MPDITQIQIGNTTYDLVDTIARSTSLSPASSTTLGGIKVGGGLSITTDGTLSSTIISISNDVLYITS